MSWDSKVLWTEGLFLQPHHFQQADRYTESLIRGLSQMSHAYNWGVYDLEIDYEALKVGQFAIKSCAGLAHDGTPFRVPESDRHPTALEVPPEIKDCTVYLCLPQRRQGAAEVDVSGTNLSQTRLTPEEIDVTDATSDNKTPVPLAVGTLRLQFALEVDDLADLLAIPIARIIEVRPDQEVVLDTAFIASCLDATKTDVLSGFAQELEGMLNHRATALAGRMGAGGAKGVGEIQDFLLLMVINRALPALRHLMQSQSVHPSTFFDFCATLAGELSTFMAANRMAPSFPPYQHHALTTSFAEVIRTLRDYLSTVLEQNAILIRLDPRQFGISVGTIADRRLIGSASFVMAVKSDVPAERLRQNFAAQAKLGPTEEIRQLVNSALPGIPLTPMPVAPRQVPYNANAVYFEVGKDDALWSKMTTSGGIAIHVSGEYPNLEMELWAIRS